MKAWRSVAKDRNLVETSCAVLKKNIGLMQCCISFWKSLEESFPEKPGIAFTNTF
jgi:hypothetical protein